MHSINYSQNIPVRAEYDIFIAGGGPAGISAAATAARKGSKVFLAEGHCCFGGMGTAAYVPMFMQFGDGQNFLADGFGKEIHDEVLDNGGSISGKYLTIPAESLKRIYDKIALECGMKFSFMTTLVDVVKEENKIKYAICHGKSGLFAIEASVFIDATGDGDMAARAGAAFDKGDEEGNLMPGTLCSLWAAIDWQAAGPVEKRNHKEMLEKAFEEGIFTTQDRHHSGIAPTGKTLGSGNIGHTFGTDGTDEKSLTKAFITGRAYLPEYQEYYRRYFKGFENMELAASGSLLGIRETRRIHCDYQMKAQDFIDRSKFEDQIGCYCYEVDIHPTTADKKDMEKFTKETETYRYKKGEYYGIPYRSLIVKGFSNLLVAGRCICSDRYMQSSVRTMPGCFITGQAAGMAAYISADRNLGLRDINITELQNNLKKVGAFI